jgi:hypothetical protein
MFPAARFKRAGATDPELAALEALWGPDTDRFAAVDESCLRDELDRIRTREEPGPAALEDLTIAELRAIADDRDIDLPARATKAEIIAAVEGDGDDPAGEREGEAGLDDLDREAALEDDDQDDDQDE